MDSKSSETLRVRLVTRIAIAAAVLLAMSVSCSGADDDGKRGKPKAADNPFAEYSIKLYTGAARTRVDIPPLDDDALSVPFGRLLAGRQLPPLPEKFTKGLPAAGATGDSSGEQPAGSNSSAKSKPQAAIGTPDGGVIVDGSLRDDRGWALVYGAAYECGMGSDRRLAGYPQAQNPQIAPWIAPESYFIFQAPPQACDHQLAYLELMVCVADKLAEVADTPAALRWSKVPKSPTHDKMPPGPWIIPVQAERDRFIARDLAIHILALVAFTDLTARPTPPGAAAPQRTCAQAYGEAATLDATSPSPAVLDNYYTTVFGIGANQLPPYLPPKSLPITLSNFAKLAESRILFNTHVLRAAGRLLREQIPKGVVANLAGAERQRGRATDPARGARLMWGAESDAARPYNSLAHSTRVLAGRWERGVLEDLPWLPCSTVPPLKLLEEGLHDEYSARHKARAIRTAGQATAAKLVDEAGIALPEATILEAPAATLRSAIKAQLVANAAKLHDKSGDPGFMAGFTTWGEGKAIDLAFGEVADEDLRAGLLNSLASFRQLASVDEIGPFAATNPGGGMAAAGTVASLSALGGVAVDGGMPRGDLAVDYAARAGGIHAASQCSEFNGLGGAVFADAGYLSVFQNAFHIGDTLRRRVVALREEAKLAFPSTEEVVNVPGRTAAELRTWAGEGRMVLFPVANSDGNVSTLHVFLLGFNPEDFAAKDAASIADEIVLVHGRPWVADCAARLRTSCPADFDTQYLARATSSTVWSDIDPTSIGFDRSWARVTGFDGTIIELVFDVASAGPKFDPAFKIMEGADQLFVVSRHDPVAPTGKGRVLGPLALRQSGGTTAMVVGKYSEDLIGRTIGVSKKQGALPFELFVLPTSEPPSYCLEGVERDPFVPLENELTSDSDDYESSWRHYLKLAKEAAIRADDLGQQLIQIGLERDLRREAAGEALAQICGDYTALDDVNINEQKGTIEKSATDKALNTCLGEDKFDVVFLTSAPPELLALPQSGVTQWLRDEVLRCSDAVASENPLCGKAALTFDALGLSPYVKPAIAEPAECDAAAGVVGSLAKPSGLNWMVLVTLANSPWVSAPALRAAASAAQVRLANNGHWSVWVDGARIMSTDDAAGKLWPACVGVIGTDCAWDNPAPGADPLAVLFDQIFRADKAISLLGPAGRSAYLWRVQGAFWMLGGLSGEVPANLISGFVPAARLQPSSWPAGAVVPEPTLFAHSVYFPAPGGWRLGTSPTPALTVTDSDIALIGTVEPIQVGAFDYAASVAPSWVRDIYTAPADRYLHVPASNISYSPGDLASSVGPESAKAVLKPESVSQWLTDQALRFQAMKCTTFQAGPPSPTQNQKSAQWHSNLAKRSKWSAGTPTPCLYTPEDPGSIILGQEVIRAQRYKIGKPACFAGYTDPLQHGTSLATADCASDPNQNELAPDWRPSRCSPDQRLALFVNSYPHLSPCAAAAELTQAITLGCVISRKASLPVPTSAPSIEKVEDIQKLERWVGELERFSSNALSRLYLQGIPHRVVSDFKSGSVGTGSLKGDHGQLVLELESSINDVATGWFQLTGLLGKTRAAIQNAEHNIDVNKLEGKILAQQAAISRWQVHSKIAHAIANAVSGFGIEKTFNPVGGTAQAAASAADLKIAHQELDALGKIEDLQNQLQSTKLLQVLLQLEDSTNTLYTDIYTTLSALRKSTATTAQFSEALRLSELTGQYQAAKGSGVDFFQSEGEVVKFPVNIVLNRQYDSTKQRYERALFEARYLAYVARIAIEQRLGLKLEFLAEKVGPLEAPADWVAQVCSMSGVNYEELRDVVVPDGGFSDPDGGTSTGAESEFADMFIGDYVDKLEKFVEFYNMEYPAHDGDDVAVISLRDELLGPGGVCTQPSPNLLLYSSDLTSSHLIEGDPGVFEAKGWVKRRCTTADDYCLEAAGATTLTPPPDPPDADPASGVTWLREEPITAITDVGMLDEINATVSPARIVYQAVKLQAGPHVVSWWDQARDLSGGLASTGQAYPVIIYDSTWSPIATQLNTSHVDSTVPPTPPKPWSDRRTVSFNISAPTTVYIAFGASESGAGPGSVAIANVQLESGTMPGPYFANGSSSLVFSDDCAAGSSANFQKAFQYKCHTTSECFYELSKPFPIDTRALDRGASNLIGKLAKDNFNYRHITLALNAVGTGVVDCTLEPTPSCYGSAYIEYSLDHAAFDVKVLSHLREEEAGSFNFGLGSINRGKALAAERFITLPVGSADAALLAQPAFEKREYMGRPLDGGYRLRVYDKPSLRWNKIEDLQFVLKYRYWSRIQPQPSGG